MLQVVSDTEYYFSRDTFLDETSLNGCTTNFANRYQSCDYAIVEAREADSTYQQFHDKI